VVSLVRVPGTYRVYNMTVEGQHVYYVSPLGLLAHNAWCDGEHHPIPQYLGGNPAQDLYGLKGPAHQELHDMIDDALYEEFGADAPGGRGTQAWADFFSGGSDRQGRAYDAVLKASAEFDQAFGTNVAQGVIDNYNKGNWTAVP
jgi:hypothetical protein